MEKLRAGIRQRHVTTTDEERKAIQREAAELPLMADAFFDEIKSIEARRST
jgi:hypothetical protein